MTSIDNLADEIMVGLQEYAELADDAMKKAVKKTATTVKKEIEAVLTQHEIYYTKSEAWIESERLYEVLYEMEV